MPVTQRRNKEELRNGDGQEWRNAKDFAAVFLRFSLWIFPR